MSCQRPDTGVVLATQEDLVAIGIEMLALDVEISEVRMYIHRNGLG